MSDIYASASYRKSVRRQFWLSVALLICMATAAFAAGFAAPIKATHHATKIDDDGVFVGRLVAINDR